MLSNQTTVVNKDFQNDNFQTLKVNLACMRSKRLRTYKKNVDQSESSNRL